MSRIQEVFQILGCRGNLSSVSKAQFISCSRINYFEHACLAINLVFISRLTGEQAAQNLKKKLTQF